MIDVQQISRKYNDFLAVDGVSFEIGRGEIVGLLGHNGAGKSTIMKMLTGYLEPSQGQILIAGEELLSDRRRAQARIGYLPENCPLYPEMSVIDFLDYTASLRGLSEQERVAAIRRAIAQTALQAKATATIATLSRGYRQRVGVAQALLHQPEILILDEPTNGLDPSQIEHMRALIRELGRQATVMISTHILQEVEAICDRVLILRNGRLALNARLEELTRGRGLLLSCSARPAEVLARFRSLPGVAEVEVQSEGDALSCYRLLAHEDAATLAPLVATEVTAKGWQLYELRREERTLEKVFHEISTVKGEVDDAA
jgi:gliding motility-associated transport system ATP-binding protein